MEEKLVNILLKNHLTISTAESCTGGLICARLVSVAGVSGCLNEAIVTYANEAKNKRLGVPDEILSTFGAVSEQTCKCMAVGCCNYAGSDMSLVSTGIAGPDGGTDEKPVGLVYLGCCFKGQVFVKKCQFTGDRDIVRNSAAKEAIRLGVDVLNGVCNKEV